MYLACARSSPGRRLRTQPARTTRFFRIIQNKLHFAGDRLTAAEPIARWADRPRMGLTSWRGGDARRRDGGQNYLKEPEIAELNRIVVMWLDFAEDRRCGASGRDWQTRLDGSCASTAQRAADAGSVSKETGRNCLAEFAACRQPADARGAGRGRSGEGAGTGRRGLEHEAQAPGNEARLAGQCHCTAQALGQEERRSSSSNTTSTTRPPPSGGVRPVRRPGGLPHRSSR